MGTVGKKVTKNNRGIYIAFGANLSNPKQTFGRAITALRKSGVKVVEFSGLWQSPAWPPGSDQPDYINACAQIETDLDAPELLTLLHRVESEFGRLRTVKNAARTLDLDLLDYKSQILNKGGLTIPHPRMLDRGFVLLPLSEIAPDWIDPANKEHIWDHIARLPLKDVDSMRLMGRL